MGECLCLKHGIPSWTWAFLGRWSTLLYLTVLPVPPPFPYLPPDPIPNYLYIFIFKGEDLAWGMLHVAGRGLPLKDGALYYTLRFPLYHRHSPYLPNWPMPNYLYIYLFFYGREPCLWRVARCWTWAFLNWFGSITTHSKWYTNTPCDVFILRYYLTRKGYLNPHEKPLLAYKKHKKTPWIYPYYGYTHETSCKLFSSYADFFLILQTLFWFNNSFQGEYFLTPQ